MACRLLIFSPHSVAYAFAVPQTVPLTHPSFPPTLARLSFLTFTDGGETEGDGNQSHVRCIYGNTLSFLCARTFARIHNVDERTYETGGRRVEQK